MNSTVIAMATNPATQSAIEAATRRNSRLFVAYIGLLIVTALVIAFFTWLVWDAGNKVQDAIQGDANARIAEAQATSDKATEGLGKANVKIAELNTQAEGLRANTEKARADIAKANLRAVEAGQRALETELELAKFKAPRSISPEEQQKLIFALKPFAGQHFAFAVFPEPEPLALLRVLNELLKSAGWERVPSQIQREGGVLIDAAGESAAPIFDSGIDALLAPDDTDSISAQAAFCSALIAAGIPCERHRTPQLAGKTPRAITISIGKKP